MEHGFSRAIKPWMYLESWEQALKKSRLSLRYSYRLAQ